MNPLLKACILAFVFLAMTVPTSGETPLLVEVEPNAILEMKNGKLPPLAINVRGVTAGTTLRLQVVARCGRDSGPGPPCPALYERESRPANDWGVLRDQLSSEDLAGLRTQSILWLRAVRHNERSASAVPQAGYARFMITDDPCRLFETVIDAFLGGECDPGLQQALRRHRGPLGLEDVTFEVRRFELRSETSQDDIRIAPVPATRGATGVAWESQGQLLVTMAPAAGGETGDVGLFRIDVSQKGKELLWAPPSGDERLPAAPLALPDGRVAFVRQPFSAEEKPGGTAAWLSVWEDGRIVNEVPLPYKIHQLVTAAAAKDHVLALTLGTGANQPAFLLVDLENRTTEVIGYDHVLYHAAMRSPDKSRSVIAFEDNAGHFGWEIVLVDRKGRWLRDLVHRREHDLLPAWRPDGTGVAYLAEVDRGDIAPRRLSSRANPKSEERSRREANPESPYGRSHDVLGTAGSPSPGRGAVAREGGERLRSLLGSAFRPFPQEP